MFYSNHQYVAAYWSSITIGIAYSSMYPLAYTLPVEFDQKISDSQASTIMLISMLGEGILTTLIGYLMKLFGPQTLFIFLLGSGLILYLLLSLNTQDLKKNQPMAMEEVELKQRMMES